jgi:hypothetical protein
MTNKMSTEEEPYLYGRNPTMLELLRRAVLFIPILSTRPRQEMMKEGKEEKRAAVFWVF